MTAPSDKRNTATNTTVTTPPIVLEARGQDTHGNKVPPRANWPVWAKQLPTWSDPVGDKSFQLIPKDKIREALPGTPESVIKDIEHDLDFLERELMPLFRDCDQRAKMYQNRYRKYQIGFVLLAAAATFFGSLQAVVAQGGNIKFVPYVSAAESFIALLSAFLAAVSGRRPLLALWLEYRRKAESLRREYFRYVMHLDPYRTLTPIERQKKLSIEASNINRGLIQSDS